MPKSPPPGKSCPRRQKTMPKPKKERNARVQNGPDPPSGTAVRTFFTRMNLFLFDHGAKAASVKKYERKPPDGGKPPLARPRNDTRRGACFTQYTISGAKSTAIFEILQKIA
ncbi:hypothetical protein LI073_06405 [bacterium 210917-SL.2.15]|nr:hypothetical protein [bacterium 210917-SL.2.15]